MPAKKHSKVVHHKVAKHSHTASEESYKLALLGAITVLLVVLFVWYQSVQPSTSMPSPTRMMDKGY